jgi:hypothetical protein
MPPLRKLCFTVLFAAALGCQSDRPKPVSTEVAMKHFNDQIANHCPGKQVNPEKFNEFAKDYLNDADTQSQQLITLDTKNACGANDSRPECFNAGFVQAEIQLGGIDDIVQHACNSRD